MKHFFAWLMMTAMMNAAINIGGSATGCTSGTVNSQILGAGPMTVAVWYKVTATTGSQHAVASPGSFSLAPVDNGDCGAADVAFVKFGQAGVCTSHIPATNVWEFAAAVVNSGNTSVHFLFMTAAGVVTTQNVADTHAFNSPGSVGPIAGSNSQACANPLKGVMAQGGVWSGVALSDAELQAFARNGALAVGRATTLYWPLFYGNAATVNIGDNYPTAGGGGNRYHNISVVAGGSATVANHCPCGDPF